MQIYVLRHGIAEDAGPGRPDSDRALTDEGKEKLRRVLKRARAGGASPSLILSSPYKRAIETAEIAADVLGCKEEIQRTRALLPEASPFQTWEEIRAYKGQSAILLASHEPLTGSLVSFLLNSPALEVEMKKAALVRIDFERVTPQPHGILKWMLVPSLAE
ncbi:MAG TPA: phosphohistidine phosphatase SixA [Candidatus Sulfopaludibacter sp.]|jgi:phosphohistidine phosphatase|nr:phosphohistidine phosphatase SixA [Candidatus Sulfopaludibacter sp.]